jgi:hypothetical protein
MGNENATLLFAVPNTNWLNTAFFMGYLEEIKLGEFPASRGALSLTHPEEVGGNEVKQ